MKKVFFVLSLFSLLTVFLLVRSCIIENPEPQDTTIITTTITNITEDQSFDIVFHSSDGNKYYINRGLELGLNLETLNTDVLNKTVTLHLANVLGDIASKHISQLAIGNTIIYTEFE